MTFCRNNLKAVVFKGSSWINIVNENLTLLKLTGLLPLTSVGPKLSACIFGKLLLWSGFELSEVLKENRHLLFCNSVGHRIIKGKLVVQNNDSKGFQSQRSLLPYDQTRLAVAFVAWTSPKIALELFGVASAGMCSLKQSYNPTAMDSQIKAEFYSGCWGDIQTAG